MRTETRVINGVPVQVAVPEGNDSWKGSIVSIPELRSIPRNLCVDQDTYSVDGVGIATFEATSLEPESNSIFKPFDAPDSVGRWIFLNTSGAGGGTSGLPDPLGHNGAVLFSDGASYILRRFKASDIQPDFTASFGANTSTVEVGVTVTNPSLHVSYNDIPLVVRFKDSDFSSYVDLNPPTLTSFTSPYAFTKTAQTSVTFTLEVTAPDSTVVVRTAGISWRPRRHWGVSSAADEAAILGLTGSDLNSGKAIGFTLDCTAGNRITYAFPSGNGTPVFAVGGFVGGFHLVTAGLAVTNSYGVSTNYDVWQSDNTGLGVTTVAVS